MSDKIEDIRARQAEETEAHYKEVSEKTQSDSDEWLEANSLDVQGGTESEEEAVERVRRARATGIFGDTPTDPTIGDPVVPAADQEAATQSTAEADIAAEEGDDEAESMSPEEKARQGEYGLDDETVDELGDDSETVDEEDEELSAADKVERIEAAESPEEVDRLAEGDDRVTVQRAAEKKRSSWS